MSQTIKNVLFVCIGNSCRSQMAEGFLHAYGGDSIHVYSAGTHPAGIISGRTVEVMQEKGIDIRRQRSKGLDEIDLDAMDVVVTLGCCSAAEICPLTYKGTMQDWNIVDPIGQPIEIFRMVRDDIERRVIELVNNLRTEGEPDGGPSAKPESGAGDKNYTHPSDS